ncbi:MAG: KpsF/GutQ family sugar-phosphate isomerase [Flavobacteriales bacterium]
MLKIEDIIQQGKNVIFEEAKAVEYLATFLDEDFAAVVQTIHNSKGRVVLTGIGKSAAIANKIVATMNSTGTPAIFMHAADAIHGDLGMVQTNDVVICISKSGNTPEIKVLVPLIKNMGNALVGLTANKNSYLGEKSDYILHAFVEKEACPNNLAPTTSTTAQLVLGDALAICLLKAAQFSDRDFAKYHPGGALGKRLYLRVEDLIDAESKAFVDTETDLKDLIINISKHRLGATAVLNNNSIEGIVTDGDIRRMLESDNDWNQLKAKDIMSAGPKTIQLSAMAAEALELMEKHNISQVLVLDNETYCGIVHLHDILKEGII